MHPLRTCKSSYWLHACEKCHHPSHALSPTWPHPIDCTLICDWVCQQSTPTVNKNSSYEINFNMRRDCHVCTDRVRLDVVRANCNDLTSRFIYTKTRRFWTKLYWWCHRLALRIILRFEDAQLLENPTDLPPEYHVYQCHSGCGGLIDRLRVIVPSALMSIIDKNHFYTDTKYTPGLEKGSIRVALKNFLTPYTSSRHIADRIAASIRMDGHLIPGYPNYKNSGGKFGNAIDADGVTQSTLRGDIFRTTMFCYIPSETSFTISIDILPGKYLISTNNSYPKSA